MNAVINATDTTLNDLIATSTKPVLIDFWATWCGPCRQIAPVLDQIATDHGHDYTIIKVDIDDAPNAAQHYGVMSVPNIVILDTTGNLRHQFTGPKPKHDLVNALADTN